MSGMTIAEQKALINGRLRDIETESKQFEGRLKKYSSELHLNQMNDLCEQLYENFNEFRLDICKCEPGLQEQYLKKVFVIVQNFLAYHENISDTSLNIFLYKSEKTPSFRKLYDHFHQFYNDMVAKYLWARS